MRLLLSFLWFTAGLSFGALAGTESRVEQALSEGYWSATEDSTGVHRGPLHKLRRILVKDEADRELDGFSAVNFSGSPANRATFTALENSLRTHLMNHGFPMARFRFQAVADVLGEPLVDVEILVQRGDGYKFGGAPAPGSKTHPETIHRLALWQVGDEYSREKIELGLRRLRRTGYFESVEQNGLFRDSLRNLLYPGLRLADAKGNRVGGLLGYDSKADRSEGLNGFLDIHLINLFGTARDLDLSFESRPNLERQAHLTYVEPWLLGLPVGARVELDLLQQDTVFWEWNRDLAFFQDIGFNSRLEVSLGSQENRDAIAGVHTEAIRSGLKLTVDARDRVPLPYSGYRAELGFSGWRRDVADSTYYLVQSLASMEGWLPLSDRWGLHLGGRAATNWPLENRFNRGENFYLGGAESLRGYREREFLTNAYCAGTLEPHLWLGRAGKIFAFLNPALVNRLVGEYHWRTALGYGAGIELSKGDWSLAVSYALNPDRGPGDGLLHVGVDNRF